MYSSSLLQLTPTTHFTAIIHVLAGTSSYELEDFVGAKFYCLHALGDGNKCSFGHFRWPYTNDDQWD